MAEVAPSDQKLWAIYLLVVPGRAQPVAMRLHQPLTVLREMRKCAAPAGKLEHAQQSCELKQIHKRHLTILSNVVAYGGRSNRRTGRCLSPKSCRPTRHPSSQCLEGARRAAGSHAPAAALARDRPRLPEEGRPKPPVFPLQVFPGQWREWVKDAAQGGLVGGLHRAGAAGIVAASAARAYRPASPRPGASRRSCGRRWSAARPAARRRRSNGCAVRSARSSACWRAKAARRLSFPMPRCRRWRRPWPSGGRACCYGATSRTAWLAGLGARPGGTRASAGGFLDTWGAIGLPWGREKIRRQHRGLLDPERLDAAL